MAVANLHDLNQRYVRLTDRCRSQWTFYQLLHGIFKHLRNETCPIEIDFQAFFTRLRELGQDLAHPDAARTEKSIAAVTAQLDKQATALLQVDATIPPSLLRRFVDRLRTQDEKLLLAIVKFYLDCGASTEDALDKIDLLFTRLAEIPRADGGGSLVREAHEIERLVQPLLSHREQPAAADAEVEILQDAVTDLRQEVLRCRSFADLVSGGSLDRFRAFKRRLGEALLHPRVLPAVLETTIAIKNRFRQLWDDEEAQILDDTNRVRELQRQLAAHPELMSADLREALDRFEAMHDRYETGRQDDNIRREDVIALRVALKDVLEQFDAGAITPPPAPSPAPSAAEEDTDQGGPRTGDAIGAIDAANLPIDPLLTEYMSKIAFAIELAGRDKSPDEVVHAKELATLRVEMCEVAAYRRVLTGEEDGSLAAERDRLLVTSAALRVRMDEEAREIDRLQRRGSERFADILERATQSLQRASEIDRRFTWLIEDALYRGETAHLEALHTCRFRLLRAYSGLWLIHHDRGGTSPF